MRFLANNMAVIITAISASAIAWAFGGTRSDWVLKLVPWLSALLIETLLFFPQHESNEHADAARKRVWRALRKDPLVWIALGLIALLTIPFANTGLCEICDRALIAQGFKPAPPVSLLPFCVNTTDHLNVFLWFLFAMSCLLVTKHSLNRDGKRMLLEMIVWNGFALAILGFIQTATQAPGPLWQPMKNVDKAGDFFSTFGYPNMAGDYFVTLFGLAVALWRWHYEEVWEHTSVREGARLNKSWRTEFRRKHYMLIPAALFFFAALNTLSRAAIILVTCTAAVYFFHTLSVFASRMDRAKRVKLCMMSLMILGLLIFFATVFMPEDIHREVSTLNSTEVLTRVTGKGQYHARVATELWKAHPLFGCGGWGYKHFCVQLMTPEELKQMQMVGGINVHNDYLQFMAEHGLAGFGALVAMVVLLLVPVGYTWRVLCTTENFTKHKKYKLAKPAQIFVMPAPVFFILTTAVATLIHCFGDCPLRSPAVLALFYIDLAAIPGFMPEVEEE